MASEILKENLDKLHTTDLGIERIKSEEFSTFNQARGENLWK